MNIQRFLDREITSKECEVIFNVGDRQGRRKVQLVRDSLGRVQGQVVTVAEFIEHFGITLEYVLKRLKLDNKEAA